MSAKNFICFFPGIVVSAVVIAIASCNGDEKRDDPIPPTARQFRLIQEEYPEASRLITSLFLIVENRLLPSFDSNKEFHTKWNCVQNAWYNHQYSTLDGECPLEEKIADELLEAALNIPHPVLQPCNEKCFGRSAPLPVQINCFRDCIRAAAKQNDSISATIAFKEIQSNPRFAEGVKLLNSLLLSFADASQPPKDVELARSCAMEAWFNHSFVRPDCPIENQLATDLLTSVKCTGPILSKMPKVEKCCEECKRFLDGTAEGDFMFRKCVSACLIR